MITAEELEGMRVLHDRILIRKDPVQEKIGRIYVPEFCRQPSDQGVVVSIGTGDDYNGKPWTCELRVGDRVVFNKLSGSPKTIDGVDYQTVRYPDILAVIEAEES